MQCFFFLYNEENHFREVVMMYPVKRLEYLHRIFDNVYHRARQFICEVITHSDNIRIV